MATRGPRGPSPRSPGPRPAARPARSAPALPRSRGPAPAAPEGPLDARAAASLGTPGALGREARDAQARWLGEGEVGADALSPARFAELPELVATRHLFARMARPGPDRAAAIGELAELLLALGDGPRARRVLDPLFLAERFYDVYPLELLAAVLERAPCYVPRVGFGPIVENRRFLETRIFEVESLIPLELPLAAKLRAFAIRGGPQPGYCLAPGPPGRYVLELAAGGRFELLLGARVGREDRVDQVRVWVEEGPESRQ